MKKYKKAQISIIIIIFALSIITYFIFLEFVFKGQTVEEYSDWYQAFAVAFLSLFIYSLIGIIWLSKQPFSTPENTIPQKIDVKYSNNFNELKRNIELSLNKKSTYKSKFNPIIVFTDKLNREDFDVLYEENYEGIDYAYFIRCIRSYFVFVIFYNVENNDNNLNGFIIKQIWNEIREKNIHLLNKTGINYSFVVHCACAKFYDEKFEDYITDAKNKYLEFNIQKELSTSMYGSMGSIVKKTAEYQLATGICFEKKKAYIVSQEGYNKSINYKWMKNMFIDLIKDC